ncbi:MAG: membrane protein insertion efficiency factor YidD [Leptospiraceae bacterium]|nr:membrane protein insertion efficiency factor YidD [Leptospiraceae bacterium]
MRFLTLFLLIMHNFLYSMPDASTGWEKQPETHIHEVSSTEWPIIFFQKILSPQDGPVCRFRPTCSRFSREAIRKYGFFTGAMISADRLIRDNPFNPPEIDEIPTDIFQ